jgi:hypothetical protein
MRMLLHAKFPPRAFNKAVRDGTVGEKIRRILDEAKPEAVYFTDYEGRRGAILVVDIKDPSQVPALAEPWFLAFKADVEFHVAMTPEDLARGGLEELGKKWGSAGEK